MTTNLTLPDLEWHIQNHRNQLQLYPDLSHAERERIEDELQKLMLEQADRRAVEATEQHSFPVPRSPSRNMSHGRNRMSPPSISTARSSTGQVQDGGFRAYANGQNISFGGFPPAESAAPLAGRFAGTGEPGWAFPGLRPGSNTRQEYERFDSGARTPAGSSYGSAPTPPSVTSTPPIPSNQAPSRHLKRGHESTGSSPEAHRSRRPTPSFQEPEVKTPSSHSSSHSLSEMAEEIPEDVLAMLGGDPREEIKRMQKMEREAKARRERERLDEQYARQLAEENDRFDARPSLPPSSSLFRSSFQSTLDNRGSVQRGSGSTNHLRDMGLQSTSAGPSSNPLSAYGSQEQASRGFASRPQPHSPACRVKHENAPYLASVKREQPPPNRVGRKLPMPQGFVDLGSSDSDDDLSIIDGSGFVPNHRRNGAQYGPSRREIAERPHNGSSTFSGTSNVPVADLTTSPAAQRFRNVASHPGVHGGGSTSVYGSDAPRPGYRSTNSMFGNIGDTMSNAARTAYGILGSSINSIPNVTAGFGQPFREDLRGMPGAWGPSAGSSYNPFDLDEEDYFDHPNNWSSHDWRPADPAKTTEELRDLMNNIRPDEELGESDLTGSPEDMAEGCGLYEHQKRGLSWMVNMEDGTNKGGILADDMGLGKTIQAIALMVSRRSSDPKCKTTLIIAPVALLKQWENEIKVKVRPEKRLTTYLYHGSKKNTSWDTLRAYDVVLTTYGTLAAEKSRKDRIEFDKKGNPNWRPGPSDRLPLLSDDSKFYRCILDEAQNIKNRTTKSAVAAYDVKARLRFCMTGTPMMNNTAELYSLVRFLQIRPYCEWEQFNKDFVRPLRGGSVTNTDEAMRKLQAFLKAVLLRRTKKSEINGKPILTLPERTTVVDHATFDEDQLAFYRNLEDSSRNTFTRYQQAGTVGRNYSNALVLLLRLRQACCHPHLIRDYAEGGTGELTTEQLEQIAFDLSPDAIRRIKEDGIAECPICMDAVENSTIFIPCGHGTCSECFAKISDPSQAMADAPDNGDGATFKCMTCRGAVNPKKVTDWTSFQKVHMAAVDNIAEGEDVETDGETESDSNSDSDTESEDEVEDATLGGFIVNDDENDKDDKAEDDEVDADSDDDLDLDQPFQTFTAPLKKKSNVAKGKEPVKRKDPENGEESKGTEEKKLKKAKKGNKSKKAKKAKKPKGKREKIVKIKSLAVLQKEGKRNKKAKKLYLDRLRENYVSSSKIDKCVELLEEIMAREDDEKTIVFSQFTTMLDLLEVPISDRDWGYKRYDGGMSALARNDAVIDFTSKRRYKIMLVSLKAGNSGLNLTAANNVIMFDPFWNPYIEEQAVDRAHRIGQRKPVNVHRLLVGETVEDRIIALQEKKRAMIEGALDENASRNIARLGERELAFLFVSCDCLGSFLPFTWLTHHVGSCSIRLELVRTYVTCTPVAL
jgi:SNF2 family DNA or RNA helicase